MSLTDTFIELAMDIENYGPYEGELKERIDDILVRMHLLRMELDRTPEQIGTGPFAEEWEQNVFVKALKAGDMDEFRHLEKAFDEINTIEEQMRFKRGEHVASNKTWADIGK